MQPTDELNRNACSAGGGGVGGDGKVLVSITEEGDGDGLADEGAVVQENSSSAAGKLAGMLRREGRDSGRSVSSQDGSGGGKDSAKNAGNKFTPTKFSAGNIQIPGLKRKEKDKGKNGEKKDVPDVSKKADKKDKHKTRNSGSYTVNDVGDGVEDDGPLKNSRSGGKLYKEQEQLQQLVEMKIISRPATLQDAQQVSFLGYICIYSKTL